MNTLRPCSIVLCWAAVSPFLPVPTSILLAPLPNPLTPSTIRPLPFANPQILSLKNQNELQLLLQNHRHTPSTPQYSNAR